MRTEEMIKIIEGWSDKEYRNFIAKMREFNTQQNHLQKELTPENSGYTQDFFELAEFLKRNYL